VLRQAFLNYTIEDSIDRRNGILFSFDLNGDTVSKLIEKMNQALGLELRAINLYAHYAAYVKGLNRIQLEPMFQQEANESMVHAATIRNAIVKHGGECVTLRDQMEIVHTTDTREMLQGALATETKAAEVYGELLPLLEEISDRELYDAVEQIYLAELRSVEEIRLLLD
tara:strand:- start:285 stop:791 length:507 start_codon:yes stop_codon:yes gene_type:complete